MTTPYRIAEIHGSCAPVEPAKDMEVRTRPLWARVAKRILDFSCAGLGLLLLSPVLLVIGAVVKLQDGGPIFYRRRVIGPKGSFDAFKFRSMRTDADHILQCDSTLKKAFEKNFKLENDPRVTPLGAILRKYSLDELPQFFNVLRGQMSLVGPRMITAQELPKYGEYRWLLLSVKPGLTGYWQVQGRQHIDYAQRVQMDVHYIQNWSLWFDLWIVIRTPWAVVRAIGAL